MKKYFLLIIAVSLIAFQACKKDNELTNPDKIVQETISSSFNPNNIADMNEYLSDFIKDMKSTAKRDNTLLPLEEAEWHLTACLNYQHCNANTATINFEYDTIISYINVNDDKIALADLSNSFDEISKEVLSIYDSYDYENKQIVYIYSTIDKNNSTRSESVVRTVMATANNNHFYFNEWDYLCIDTLFPFDNRYHWVAAADSLEKYIKQIGRQNLNTDYYYVSIQNKSYHYDNYRLNPPIDQLSGTYYNRLYVLAVYYPERTYLSGGDMAFYLDSYLGLVKLEVSALGDFIDANVDCDIEDISGHMRYKVSHRLTGFWGIRVINNNNNPST